MGYCELGPYCSLKAVAESGWSLTQLGPHIQGQSGAVVRLVRRPGGGTHTVRRAGPGKQ